MTESLATLEGIRATRVELVVPPFGRWRATVALVDATELEGQVVTLRLGGLDFVGYAKRGGSALGTSEWLVIAGHGGWDGVLPRRSYRSDKGVMLSTVLGDAAREAGEVLAAGYADRQLGPAWTREAAAASRMLNAIVGPAGWRVLPDGTTSLVAAVPAPLPAGYTVTSYDPLEGVVELSVESLAGVWPGATVEVRDAGTLTLGTVKIEVGDTLRVRASVAPIATQDRLRAVLRGLVGEMIAERGLFGIYEYRVVTIDGDYLNLQPVSAVEELPDHARAACWPGVSGCSSEPELGSSVLVAFVNGDRGRAVVAGYIGPDGEGHVPAALIVDCADIEIGTSTGSVRLAGARTPPGARVICEGDSVVVGAESGAIVLTTQYNPALGRAMS